jgi:hypothetical protein
MRCLLALVLLFSAALAGCASDYVVPVEAKFPAELNASFECPLAGDTTLYDAFAELGEKYSEAADCLAMREFNDSAAVKYYLLAGDYYTKAAGALCGTDYNSVANLYDSAGTAYYESFYISEDKAAEALSKQSYDSALYAYQAHRKDVYSFTDDTYRQRMSVLENKGFVPGIGDVRPQQGFDLIPIGIGVLVLFGIGLIAFYIGKH